MRGASILHKKFHEQFNSDEELRLFVFKEKHNLHEIELREGAYEIACDTEDSIRIRRENESYFEH